MSLTHPAPDPTPEPSGDEVTRGLAELERHLIEHAPPPPAVEPTPATEAVGENESKRVRKLRAEVAEAHALAELQDDDAPLMLDTPKVRKRRKQAQEAARLHALAADPATRAWQAARIRRVLVTTALAALTLALAWSTAGVQTFASDGADPWSPSWVFAWLVEPFMSLALLVVVGARAYHAAAGQPIESVTLVRIEWGFLALTLGMNAWPYLPGIAATFSLSRLVLHLLGPVVAVAIVTALPIILAAFTTLDHSHAGTGGTAPSYRPNTMIQYPRRRADDGPDIPALAARVRALIAAGELPTDPGADKIRRALRVGMDTARAIRDALT